MAYLYLHPIPSLTAIPLLFVLLSFFLVFLFYAGFFGL